MNLEEGVLIQWPGQEAAQGIEEGTVAAGGEITSTLGVLSPVTPLPRQATSSMLVNLKVVSEHRPRSQGH